MKHRDVACDESEMPLKGYEPVCTREYESARKQLGTLGGGNHFIELQKDEEGNLWVMIHSGSRNLGKQVAEYYNKKAIELNEKWFSQVPKEWQLAFLPEDSLLARDYLNEMNFCLNFAYNNRRKMMDDILSFVQDEFTGEHEHGIELLNIHHNFASLENHFGQNVWVHRKGATQAKAGQLGIIPGSQGTHSYIVEGLGNQESFMSCSHGAGRKMSRSAAIKNLNIDEERNKLDTQGILHAIRGKDDLDEAPGAYKSIDEVMASQTDLVKIVHTLTPLAVVKG
jgi:tRNA-splicing ligase RtcB